MAKYTHMHINFRRLSPDTPIPEYKTVGAVAFDIAVIESHTLQPGECKLFRTGLVVQVPAGHVLLLSPRSSNAKKGIRLGNGVGIIDQDYCGPSDELFAALHNFGSAPYTVEKGERLMQGTFIPITKAILQEQSWESPDRGGFGTTG